jgi:hypothetical protein
MNKKENTLKQLEYCREKGFKGTVYYSYRNPGPLKRSKAANDENKGEETIVDNQHAEVSGPWRSGTFGKFFGENHLFTGAGDGSHFVSFKPKLKDSGQYDVYEWHVAGPNRSTKVPVIIVSGSQTNRLLVNQQQKSRIKLR